ncbi:hypothetical protein NEF87_001557 [Candidatus Lokiarchaeum ossiferum]|uniref:Uncharacterized protein n=1 Tax=Candidatus Lokiarchaeum ossiferum TaxID=2951803 RepID=A0ABY6HP43_9ARCH|nr:hypothetical protein NEF87_001557 [Candidatus Lokiarchaeum sp. B-35]
MAFEYENEVQSKDFFQKRLVKDIQATDNQVTLTGYARNLNASDEFNLDDTTGQINIRDIPDETVAIKEGKIFTVLGNVSLDGAGTKFISAQFIRDAEGINFELYLKSMELFKKII